MKKYYYVDKHARTTGNHDVHLENCPYLILIPDRMFVGAFTSNTAAVGVARLAYPAAEGCTFCMPHDRELQL